MSRYSFFRFFCAACCLLLLTGCKNLRQTIEVPVYVHDTLVTLRDVHDSTYIDRWHTIEVKGDTVFWHDSIAYIKYHTKTDTAYKVVERPVTVTKTETVEIAKPLTKWQRIQKNGFWVLLSILGVASLWKTRGIWSKLI